MFQTEEEKKKQVTAGGNPMADVSQYLAANQPAGQRLASTVGQSVVNAGNESRQATNTAQQNFTTQANASRVPYNDTVAQRASQDPRSFFQYNQVNQAPAKDQRQQGGGGRNPRYYLRDQQTTAQPLAAATQGTPEDVASFEKMRDATYGGPTDLASQPGYGDLLSKEQNAVNLTNQLNDPYGRQQLISSSTGGPSNALDQYLLNNGQAQAILKNAGAANADLAGSTDKANAAARELASGVSEEDQATKDKIAQMMGGSLTNLQQAHDLANKKQGGNPFVKAQRSAQNQADAQTLDALNRLMNQQYKL